MLASLARLDRAAEGDAQKPDWLGQLRAVAAQARALDLDQADATADYWLLLADLSETAEIAASDGARQKLAELLLTGYIDRYHRVPAAAEFVADARLSFAQLLDQHGDQKGVAKQLAMIGELSEDSPRLEEARQLIERVERIGTPIRFEAVTTRGVVWNTKDHLGSPVLIHIYADSVEPSVKMMTQIQRAIDNKTLGGIRIVSLRIGEPSAEVSPPRWPVVPVALDPGGVLEQMGVQALPTLAWLDAEGKLISIGYTTGVLSEQPDLVDAEQQPHADTNQDPPPTEPINPKQTGKPAE